MSRGAARVFVKAIDTEEKVAIFKEVWAANLNVGPLTKLAMAEEAIAKCISAKASKTEAKRIEAVKPVMVDNNINDLLGDLEGNCLAAVQYVGAANYEERLRNAEEQVVSEIDIFRSKLREHLVLRDKIATELCRIYFEIASEAIGEEEVRRRRHVKILKRNEDRKIIDASMRNM